MIRTRTLIKITILSVLALLPVGSAPAQDAASPSPAAAAATPDAGKIPLWEGSWKAEAKFEKSARTPNGGASTGTVTVKKGLLGTTWFSDYSYTGDLGPWEGHMVMAHDKDSQKWTAWWFDSIDPGKADQSIMTLQPDGLVIDSESSFQGKTYKTRMTQKFVSDDQIEEVFESDGGEGYKPEIHITYTRNK